jgi:hypothetical protein
VYIREQQVFGACNIKRFSNSESGTSLDKARKSSHWNEKTYNNDWYLKMQDYKKKTTVNFLTCWNCTMDLFSFEFWTVYSKLKGFLYENAKTEQPTV